MIDFPNKVITLVLVFLMLIVAPILWYYSRDDMISQRTVLNETEQFLDRVTDKAYITQSDIDDLYVGVNASGGTFDVKVKRYMPISVPNGDTTETKYVAVPYFDADTGKESQMTKGDIVKVTVKQVGVSPAQRMLWAFLRIDDNASDITLAATVD